ncbi:MAG: RNA 3'-terminal phosphate cyclase [Deltaproteobacteria bacterium]|nr:RNA 3'-terminal phosphate cyclase [Deltaproteobacteria bacterium]
MRADAIQIDGSRGEGGGQVLRTALALSLVTGRAFRIVSIRSKRKKPGLMRQHLTAVHAASEVGNADVSGDAVGSTELSFAPRGIRPGDWHFAVGTAGSATLVFQTVLPALLCASGPSSLKIEGGTHNPFAPPFDFIQKAFLPLINRMGPRVEAELLRHGFFPAGGGRFTARVRPAPKLEPLVLRERGEVKSRAARALVARLPKTIAERELAEIKRRLGWHGDELRVEEVSDSAGPGNALVCEVASENVIEVFTGFGEKGVSAEKVAETVAAEVGEYIESGVPVGRHLADQLLIPLALAGRGEFVTLAPTPHTTTNIEVVGRFLDVPIRTEKTGPTSWLVRAG